MGGVGTFRVVACVQEVVAKPGRYTIAIKVIDIFGNDTMTLMPITAG